MTPQGHFTVLAPIAAGREVALRALLDTMNASPGIADPRNREVPFADFDRLHFARFAILDDSTLADIEAHGVPAPRVPMHLAFIGDCDGSGTDMLAELARRAERGLRRIFSHCEGFDASGDLLAWMRAHDVPVAAAYVNWVGRTVRQILEESALRRALAAKVSREAIVSGAQAEQLRQDLREFVDAEIRAGRLTLSPAAPTPLSWRLAHCVHAVGVPLVGILLLPLFIIVLPFALLRLRWLETHDPEICPRPDDAALRTLHELEDHDITNQYTALGTVKPGRFRRWLLTLVLVAIDWTARHVFTRGYLARVQTIHFARWVFIDGKVRVVFVSNYDGSHQAYMDDFINKVAWGLNLVFSNGVGWPRTKWLLARGARIEQRFKYFQRRHQLPTQVWYKAYPGLALVDLRRNQRIREGLERAHMSERQALAWATLL